MNFLGFISFLLIIFVTFASAYFNPFNPYWDPSFDYSTLRVNKIEQIIEHINSKPNSTWTAGLNFDGNYEGVNIKSLLGTAGTDPSMKEDLDTVDVTCHSSVDENYVESIHAQVFDAREAWPSCPEIGHIRNQGRCASDWVLAPISVIADRWCIAKNGTEHFEPSAHEPLSCCKSCGWGCEKGYPKSVYMQFVNKGFASGGDYNSGQGCQPYEIEPCKSYEQCMKGRMLTPECKHYCYNKNYNQTYQQDIKKGFKVIKARCPCSAGNEMIKKGPISASMVVYEDFLTYKSGIYQHVHGERLGRLTVKLIGFNDTHEPKYWTAVNSWGPNWGEHGTFKIVRGQSECLIDNSLFSVWID